MIKTISILGLGWLGKPLSYSLISKGYMVKGSVSSIEKRAEFNDSEIQVSTLKVEADGLHYSDADFFKTDLLYINFPPKRVENIETIYPAQIEKLIPRIVENNIRNVIFISSTSVYPETNSVVFEDEKRTPDKGSGVACLAAENILKNNPNFKTTVVRFGGLIGADRNPSRFMQRTVKNGPANKPVNLIHQDDCISIIEYIISNQIWDETINACCPQHPSRKEFYQLAAEIAGLAPPDFDETESFQFKTVSSEKLVKQLGYSFKFESPLDFLKSK